MRKAAVTRGAVLGQGRAPVGPTGERFRGRFGLQEQRHSLHRIKHMKRATGSRAVPPERGDGVPNLHIAHLQGVS